MAARVTTIVPGCCDGRWPHVHFEVFAGLDAAVSGKAALLTLQCAFPEAEVAAVLCGGCGLCGECGQSDPRDTGGRHVFADNRPEQIAAQTVGMAGDAGGFTGAVVVGVQV